MLFFLSLLYLVLVLVRPQEYPFLAGQDIPILPTVLVAAVVAWVFSRDKNFDAPQYPLIFAFFGVMMFSRIINGWAGGAIEIFTSFAPVVMSFVLLGNAVSLQRRVQATMAVFGLCAVTLAAHGIEQSHLGIGWTGMPLAQDTRIQYVGIFSDPNDLGMLFVMVLPMSVYLAGRGGWMGLRRMFWLAVAITLCYGIYLTDSRGTMLAMAVVLGVYVWQRRGLFAALISAGTVFGILKLLPSRLSELDASESSAAGRVDAWYEGLQLYLSQPLFGVGSGNFTEHNSLTAHNSFVLVLAETGLVGYTLWLAFVGYGFWMMLTVLRHSPELADEKSANAWKGEVGIASALFASLAGTYSAAFFLSRSYSILLYLQAAVVVGFYTGVRRRYPSLPAFGRSRDLLRWPVLSLVSWLVLYIVVRVLL